MTKRDEGSESEKVSILQNNVANFGAKIKDLDVEVQDLKDRYRQLQHTQQDDKTILDKFKSIYDADANVTSPARLNQSNNKTIELMNTINAQLTNNIQNLSAQIANVNDTLSQKTQGLDSEVRAHKVSETNQWSGAYC